MRCICFMVHLENKHSRAFTSQSIKILILTLNVKQIVITPQLKVLVYAGVLLTIPILWFPIKDVLLFVLVYNIVTCIFKSETKAQMHRNFEINSWRDFLAVQVKTYTFMLSFSGGKKTHSEGQPLHIVLRLWIIMYCREKYP